MTRLLYFAWVREKVGIAEEDIDLPREVTTIAELVDWLSRRGEGFTDAFRNRKTVRAALDRCHAQADAPIAGAAEIAFFPPVTGG